MSDPVTTPDNPYAAPKAEVQDVATISVHNFELASRWRRLGGAFIDGTAVSLLGGIISVIGALVLGKGSLEMLYNPSQEFAISVLTYLLGAVAWFIVVGYLLITRAQSLGKWILGMKIVRSDGSRASVTRLFWVRTALPYAIYFIPIIGFPFGLLNVLWIFGKSRQCLHDKMADTIVVRV